MAPRKKTNKTIKVRDLKPKKDAKGGFARCIQNQSSNQNQSSTQSQNITTVAGG